MDNGKQPIHAQSDLGHTLLKEGKSSNSIGFGLTKREYFALHLMQGLLSGADRHSQEGDCQTWNYEHLSKISIQAADSLLEELEEGEGE
jgi:hypothetical protein